MQSQSKPLSMLVVGGGVLLLILLPPVLVTLQLIPQDVPMLMLLGVLTLLGVLLGFTMLMKLVGISDPNQALGMPEGSIRAMVTLALVGMFAVLAALVFDRPRSTITPGVTEAQVKAFRELNPELAKLAIIVPEAPPPRLPPALRNTPAAPVQPDPEAEPGAAKPAGSGNGLPAAQATNDLPMTFRIEAVAPGRTADDFVKTTMTGIMTLMTAVIAFYFGGRSAEMVQGKKSPPVPALTGISPAKHDVSEPVLGMSLVGTGLNDIKRVLIRSKETIVEATGVTSSDASASCRFAVSQISTPPGIWDVEVLDAIGGSARLAGALTLFAPIAAPPAAPPAAPLAPPPFADRSGPPAAPRAAGS